LGYVSTVDSTGQTIWIADAHRGDGKRYVVHADEKLTAFVELESAIRQGSSHSGTSETIKRYVEARQAAIGAMPNGPAKYQAQENLDAQVYAEKRQ
jgi:hypothetical protein